MNKTKIQWTEMTWNPITGCSKVSEGCKNCYAERMAKRLKAMGNPRYENGFEIAVHKDLFEKPLTIKQPKVIFVNSMSDLFHKDVTDEVIIALFDIMNRASWHTFQILTKRPERVFEMDNAGLLKWSPNIWMGTSVESAQYLNRVRDLSLTKATIKFLSCEPLIGGLDGICLDGIDWVIVGGESGPKARKMKKEWVIDIRNECEKCEVPFFFKQWGGVNKKKTGRLLDGKTYDEYPSKSHIC